MGLCIVVKGLILMAMYTVFHSIIIARITFQCCLKFVVSLEPIRIAAFWAKIAELHPERETGDLDPGTVYDLEREILQVL